MKSETPSQVCVCGFVFSGPGEYRNCETYMGLEKVWWLVCPKCNRVYKSD